MIRPRTIRYVVAALSVGVALTGVTGQGSSTAQELIHQEEVRRTIEDALELANSSSGVLTVNIAEGVNRVAALGADAVPILTTEIEQQDPRTFFFAAYALGRIGTDDAGNALREAVKTAEKQRKGDWPVARKGWACWALGLMRAPDAVVLVNTGRHLAGTMPVHPGFSALESISVMTAPGSVAALHEQLKGIDDETDPRMAKRANVLAAIRRAPDPSSIPVLLELLEDGHPILQREAAHAMGAIDHPDATAALLSRLDTPDTRVRRGVALGLQLNPPSDGLGSVVERLRVEDNPIIRGALYDLIVRASGARYTDQLLEQWGRPDSYDRGRLATVLPDLDREKIQPVLVRALQDRDPSVTYAAAAAAARIGDDAAVALLIEAVALPVWTHAMAAVEQLTAMRAVQGADAIAARLIDRELIAKAPDPHRRDRVRALSAALVAIGYTQRIDDLKREAQGQQDVKLVQQVDQLIADLELLATNRDKSKRWLDSLVSTDRRERQLAYAYFGRSGDSKAAEPLVQAFGRVEPSEGVLILDALGTLDAPATRQLIERVLTAPEFDEFDFSALRNMAAWSARRLGMYDTLVTAVDRRNGRDYMPLVYTAVLGGAEALEVLERNRLRRMLYIGGSRGKELDQIDWMRRELSHGRSIEQVDVPPDKLRI